jgi:two-component system, chemotaxis family, sensor kinase CheA
MDPRETYKEEARELLTELETSLLELEKAPDDAELIGRAFRALHTIKGSGAMFGFDRIAAFTHEVETVFDLVRDGKIRVAKDLIDLTLRAADHIRTLLDRVGGRGEGGESDAVIEGFKKWIPEIDRSAGRQDEGRATAPPVAGARSGQEGPASLPSSDIDGKELTYRIRFRPVRDIFATGTNPVLLLDELRSLGECRVVAQTRAVPELDAFDPEACYFYWDAILTTRLGLNAIKDVFIFVEDHCELRIDLIDEAGGLEDDTDYKKLGDILIERGDLIPGDLERVLSAKKKIGEILVDAGLVDAEKVQSALAEQEHIRELREKRGKQSSASTLRVASEKLDRLVNLVGELVTVRARLNQVAAAHNNSELTLISEEVERLTEDLRDNTMSIRMMAIGSTFSQFHRLVRDLSSGMGKEIVLTTEGAETELDKTMIDRLHDPLVHIIRNSIDHGIELPETRRAAGKPGQGRIHLAAIHSGAHVLIRIEDDGAGLDIEAIRTKAVEKGLIPADSKLSEQEIFSLIFASGFSTAQKVTSISGRGVGMDVVKRAIDGLRGSIEVRSEKGTGTTVTLKLPLTLAIIDGLLVKVGEGFFILPLSAVEECIELTREDSQKAHGRCMANVRGEIVPYIRLREQFFVREALPPIEQIVITGMNGNRVGFVVDRVVGEHQTVIKSLGRVYRNVDVVSGATILGDGTLALILDLPKLAKRAEDAELRIRSTGRA